MYQRLQRAGIWAFCLNFPFFFYWRQYSLFGSVGIPCAIRTRIPVSICWWNCVSDKWLESEWIIVWRPLMRPQWEEGWGWRRGWWAGESSCSFSKKSPTPLSLFSVFSPSIITQIYFSDPPFLLAANPLMLSLGALILSPGLPSALPSLTTDPWHSTCSVLCVAVPFYYWVKWQIHIWSRSPYDDSSACLQISMNVWMHLISFWDEFLFHSELLIMFWVVECI